MKWLWIEVSEDRNQTQIVRLIRVFEVLGRLDFGNAFSGKPQRDCVLGIVGSDFGG